MSNTLHRLLGVIHKTTGNRDPVASQGALTRQTNEGLTLDKLKQLGWVKYVQIQHANDFNTCAACRALQKKGRLSLQDAPSLPYAKCTSRAFF